MIIVTGAAGFIASALVARLNELRYFDLILVDDFSREDRKVNYENKKFTSLLDRKELFSFIEKNENQIDFIFHLGARTDTTEFNTAIFDELNLNYSKEVWNLCVKYAIPLVYASSAATYGDGALGYDDNHDIIPSLKPLNPYGDSKNDFDKWVLQQSTTPFFWAGLKFFNVYGPNEYHKGRMASVVWHSFNQINANGEMKLFRSHNPQYTDGGQMRDFVYVKDVANVCIWLMEARKQSGIFNLGSGKARTFLDLTKSTFQAMGKDENISFIDTPIDIRDKYQYFTEANMNKLIQAGYPHPFHTLEEGVKDYVQNYLLQNLKIY
ncbi:MAG: ADP-glyceromanno-heptose 6-epimerase precursor [Bacteroidota bacterium]